MPSLQEIERIKSTLNELGGEPEVLAERGEAIEDVRPPGEDRGAPPAREAPQKQGVQPGGGTGASRGEKRDAPQRRAAPGGRRAAARGGVPEIAPEESFDASALVGNDEELDALDSFEDFNFASWSEGTAGANADSRGQGEPRGREGPVAGPEQPGGVREGEGTEEAFPEVEPTPAAGPGEAAEEDVLAALGLTQEDLSAGEPPEGPAEAAEPMEEQLAEWAEAPAGPEAATGEPLGGLELPDMPDMPSETEAWLPEPEGGSEDFGIPPGLLGSVEQEEAEAPPAGEPEEEEGALAFEGPQEFEVPEDFTLPDLEEEPAAAPPESAEEPSAPPAEGAEEPFDFTEELGDLEGLFGAPEGEVEGEPPAFDETAVPGEAGGEGGEIFDEAVAGGRQPFLNEDLVSGEAALPEEAVPPEEAGGFDEGGAFGEEAFELPEEFRLPEEPGAALEGAEAPPLLEDQEAAPAPPSEEEADFLRALQEEILPGGEQQVAPSPAAEHVDLEGPAEGGAMESPEGEELVYDEFSLEGLGEEFGLAGEEPPAEEEIPFEAPTAGEEAGGIPAEVPAALRAEPGAGVEPVPEPARPAARPAEAGAPGRPVREAALPAELRLSDRQFDVLRRTLRRLPRNLKIAVEELIGERELGGEDLRGLVRLLAEGAAPALVAAEVSRITGTRIVIPKSFEKLTGAEFEAERGSFAYALRENILPVLRVALVSLAVAALMGFLGYRFVYRPVRAELLYRQGYSQIERQRYQLANDKFDQATSYWAFKGWFYRYAEGFGRERQFTLAAEKYEALLRRFPEDRRGTLDYAKLLTFDLAGYERADSLLKGLLEENLKDYHALLARGDNFLEWAADSPPQESAARYEDARFNYASIIDYYGQRDEVLLRMMRYFIRTDKRPQTEELKAFLDRAAPKGVPGDLYASVYAELAGYWMDKGQYDGVADMLFGAMDADPQLPEVYYNLGRFYNHIGNMQEEARALKTTVELLEQTQPLTKRRLFTLIDAHRRFGETYWRQQEYLEAERNYRAAIRLIEEVQGQEIFGPEEVFGRVYEDQGDVAYYVSRDLADAVNYYLKAVENGHRPPELDYKIGYVSYAGEDFENSLLRFSTVVDRDPRNENALFALGNSLYLAGFYSSAQGYFLRLLDLLETRRERIPLLLINENPEHRALAESIMKTYNNLGVTLYRLGMQRRDPDKESSALVTLTFSSEQYDMLSRDPETAVRGITRNLAYLNQRGILYPQSGFVPQLYLRIPIDMETLGP